MKIINNVVEWYIHTILMKNLEKYDSPGMLVAKFHSPIGEIFTRIVLVPEGILINLEKHLLKKNGSYEKTLYSIGKHFGYNVAYFFKSPTLKKQSEADVKKFLEFIIKFNFSTWSKSTEIQKLDMKEKFLRVHHYGHVVCRANGIGCLLTQGMDGGFGAYIFADTKIESVQLKCEGRGDSYCEEVVALPSFFQKNKISFISSTPRALVIDEKRYHLFNSIRKCRYATHSLKKLIEQKIFRITDMHIKYKDLSLINMDDFFIYILERDLDAKAKKILYDISFEEGKKITNIPNEAFITNFVSALGWGDLLIQSSKNKVSANLDMFPWRSEEKDIKDFAMVSGFISGLLSSHYKRDIKLKRVTKAYSGNKFSLRIE